MKEKKLSLFTLVMISCAFVISVRNFPTEAETGMHMIIFALIAAIGFFIPVALVSAELATGWPKLGGIYAWIKHALGARWGFVAVWLQWFYMIIGSVAMLYFVGGTIPFLMGMPALANNKIWQFAIVAIITWGATLINFRGMKLSGKLSTIGFLGGVLIPGVMIIVLGAIYLIQGNPLQLDMTFNAKNLLPSFSHLTTLVLMVAFMRTFTGIEASAAHANEVKNPKRDYPLAIFIVVSLALLLNVLGSLAVGIVVPQKQISLAAGLLDAFNIFFAKFGMAWIVPIIGFLVAMGAIGEIITWTAGPVKGVWASAKNGELPRFFRKANKQNVPTRLMLVQATIITTLGGSLLLMPKLNTAFWMSTVVACCLYFFMYALMLLSGLILRYKEPKVKRVYKVPLGNFGMWTVCILGLLTLSFGFVMAFLPPAQLYIENTTAYVAIVSTAILSVLAMPFIIYSMRKPSWGSTK